MKLKHHLRDLRQKGIFYGLNFMIVFHNDTNTMYVKMRETGKFIKEMTRKEFFNLM